MTVPIPDSAREILKAFLDEPETVDSKTGITRWRIAQHRITYTSEQVSQAVEWLSANGLLVQVGASNYRLNPDRVAEARRLVGDSLLMAKASRWIDAALLCFLREHEQAVGDHPLARSHQQVVSLLVQRSPAGGVDLKDARLALRAAEAEFSDVLAASTDDEPLAALSKGLSLTGLELQAILLCLAPELDVVYQLAYGVLNDDMSRRRPTLGLICQLDDPRLVRDLLADSGGLVHWRLLDQASSLPPADESLHLDPAIVGFVLGDRHALRADSRIGHLLRFDAWPGATWLTRQADMAEVGRLAQDLAAATHDQWTVLYGEDPGGWRALVEAARRHEGLRLARIRLAALAQATGGDAHDLTVRLARLVLVLAAVPVLDAGDPQWDSEGLEAVAPLIGALRRRQRGGLIILGDLERAVGVLPRERCHVRRRGLPAVETLSAAYRTAASEAGLRISFEDSTRLAHAFPLPFDAIDEALRLAILEGAAATPPWDHADELTSACRRVASPDLPRFARRVEPVFDLDDVVLPPDRRAQLNEIVAHVRHASQVLHDWGFDAQLPYGRGVAALFTGPSGSGKSMAAQAVARALGTHAYVVDLSRIVSKYIGESEKHIDIAFRDAQRAGAVLQIDEAEAMFGKRSEVKDSHDRYANLEVAYLLQRMEAFDGVAILTTNFRQNLDSAFLRRLRFVVEFPRPDADAREAIWRRCLPASAPFRDGLPITFLARRLELTGGNIRQITVRAAFLAAAEQTGAIELRHVIAATRAELFKLGMNSAERELAELEASERGAGAHVA